MRAWLFFLPMAAFAAGCTNTPACTEWVALGHGAARSLVYRNYPLDAVNPHVKRALVVVHGSDRGADNNFRTAMAAAFLAGAFDDTLVVAPRFASNEGRECADKLDANEVSWPCSGNSWRSGGASAGHPELTSFDFADQILRKLARKDVFPNLAKIVVAGHSAGGQFVSRYEMANRVHESLGVSVVYVVANPSSYAYPDALRPGADGKPGAFRDARNCITYDQWPYGLEKRGGYTEEMSGPQLIRQLASRPATYLLGEFDILPVGGFDSSCPAMAQGTTRLARGQAFVAYVQSKYGARQQAVVVPACGHNSRCIFTADAALPVLFPKP